MLFVLNSISECVGGTIVSAGTAGTCTETMHGLFVTSKSIVFFHVEIYLCKQSGSWGTQAEMSDHLIGTLTSFPTPN